MKKILKIFILIVTLTLVTTNVFAACEDITNPRVCSNSNECHWDKDTQTCHTRSITQETTEQATEQTTDWWSGAQTFFNGAYGYDKDTENITPLNDIIEIVKQAGNAVFIIVTIVLGIKYMLASSEGKADVKEGITGLVVAMLLFYGWTALDEILRNSLGWFFESGTAENSINKIYSLAVDLLNYVSIGVVLFVGVKFLFSGAEGKADLKGKGVPFVIGLVMTFGTVTFLKFILKVLGDFI